MNDPDAYRDFIRPRGLTWIKTTLRVTVAVQCLGAAALRLSSGHVSPVSELLVSGFDWPEAQALQLDDAVAYLLVASSLLIVLRPPWPVLLPVTMWFLANALVPVVSVVGPATVIDLLTQALQVVSPLALLVLDFWPPKLKTHLTRTLVSMWLLRLAAAVTFAGLGLLAVRQSVRFGPSLDLLQEVADSVLGVNMGDGQARCWLGVIGGLNLAFALNLLVTRSKPLLVCMSAWGFAMACAVMVASGPAGYPETLVRFAEGGTPLVLLLYFSLSIKEFPPELLSEN